MKDKLKNLFAKCSALANRTDLLKSLEDLGFFVAPASTKYHGSYAGGLFDHSFAVTEALLDLTKKLNLTWSREESPYIIGIFHDLCKCDNYILQSDGTYIYNKYAPSGHGDKSQRIAEAIYGLTEEEAACIRWHMGAFDDKENWRLYCDAVKKFPNVLYTHTADMVASQIQGI